MNAHLRLLSSFFRSVSYAKLSYDFTVLQKMFLWNKNHDRLFISFMCTATFSYSTFMRPCINVLENSVQEN